MIPAIHRVRLPEWIQENDTSPEALAAVNLGPASVTRGLLPTTVITCTELGNFLVAEAENGSVLTHWVVAGPAAIVEAGPVRSYSYSADMT